MSNTEKDVNSYLFEEWKECRSSIARFDEIIIDIRKYGFTIITGLLSADAFLFAKVEELQPREKVVISIVMMALIFALFVVDRCYEVFLLGAVKRAKKIEDALGLGLSTDIQRLTEKAKTDSWGITLYILFIIVSIFPPLATTVEPNLEDIRANLSLIYVMVLATSIFLLLIFIYHYFGAIRLHQDIKDEDNEKKESTGIAGTKKPPTTEMESHFKLSKSGEES